MSANLFQIIQKPMIQYDMKQLSDQNNIGSINEDRSFIHLQNDIGESKFEVENE